jgi:hypothetical protein
MASSAATCQAIELAGLLGEIHGSATKHRLLKIDNMFVIDLINNLVYHGRSKHIRIRYHFIRECVAEGSIVVQFVSTNDQLARHFDEAIFAHQVHRNEGEDWRSRGEVARTRFRQSNVGVYLCVCVRVVCAS